MWDCETVFMWVGEYDWVFGSACDCVIKGIQVQICKFQCILIQLFEYTNVQYAIVIGGLCNYVIMHLYMFIFKCVNMNWFLHAILWVYYCVSNWFVCTKLFGYAVTWKGNCDKTQ